MANNSEEYYKQMADEIHKTLCANHMTSAVADFLANLAVDVARLKEVVQP